MCRTSGKRDRRMPSWLAVRIVVTGGREPCQRVVAALPVGGALADRERKEHLRSPMLGLRGFFAQVVSLLGHRVGTVLMGRAVLAVQFGAQHAAAQRPQRVPSGSP